jgi:hypothetical protein
MLLGSGMLEVATGMAFFFLLLAIVVSTVTELISRALGLRSSTLKVGIGTLLSDPNLQTIGSEFYKHPLVKSLKGKKRLRESYPSYLHARTFASALIDTVSRGASTVAQVQAALAAPSPIASGANVPADPNAPPVVHIPDDLKRQLTILIGQAGDDMDKLRKHIETWYDDGMERVSGWYKRKAQVWTGVAAAVLIIAINADGFSVANDLLKNPTARDAFVAQATAISAQATTNGVPALNLQDVKTQLAPVGLSIGWDNVDMSTQGGLKRLAGWIITFFAVLMGAPFWFDALSRLVNLRASGTPPARSDAAPAPTGATPAT